VAKSESRETTFDHDLRGLAALEPVLERLTGELCQTLVKQDARGRTIGIKVRLDDFSTHTRARSLDAAVSDFATIHGVALELLRRLAPERPVRLLGVRVAAMQEGRREQSPDAPQLQLQL
jgi:DNA polymerase-4